MMIELQNGRVSMYLEIENHGDANIVLFVCDAIVHAYSRIVAAPDTMTRIIDRLFSARRIAVKTAGNFCHTWYAREQQEVIC